MSSDLLERTIIPVGADNAGLHRLIEEQTDRTPHAVAVRSLAEELTYADLDARANRLAHHLLATGVGPERLVGIQLDRSPEMMVAILAVLKAGAAYVPLDPGYPAQRLAATLEDAGLRLVLTTTALAARLPQDDRLHVVCLDRHARALGRMPDTRPDIAVRGDMLAYVIYTSGSTGRPKGAMVPHGALVNYLRWIVGTFPMTGRHGTLVHTPFGFDLTVPSLFGPLLTGADVVLLPPAAGLDDLAGELSRGQDYSFVRMTPAHLRALTEPLAAAGRPVSVRALLVGGEELPSPLVRRWAALAPDTRIVNQYGATEVTVGGCHYDTTGAVAAAGTVPLGRANPGISIAVVDEHLRAVAPGSPGEIVFGGAGVGRGYLHRPALTADRFVPDPQGRGRIYRTGDRGRFLPSGDLEIIGRVDRQVKIRGFRIEPGEIEARLRELAGVRDAVVQAFRDGSGDRRLAAYLHRDADGPDRAQVRARLADTLPPYMVPAAVVPLPQLPLTSNGKVDRAALPAPGPDDMPVGTGVTTPRDVWEELVADVWSDVLGVPDVCAEDDFFALGGHSLLATAVVARVRARAGVQITVRDVFRATTVAALADVVRGAGTAAPAGPVARADRESAPLSPGQQRLWFLDHLTPGTATYNVPVVLHVEGPLDVSVLRAALRRAEAAHGVLRTRFVVRDGVPQQLIGTAGAAQLLPVERVVDRAAARTRAEAEIRAPFDLDGGPLWRTRLLRVSEQEHLLVCVLHHAICDDRSLAVFASGLARDYAAGLAGPPGTGPERPRLQFGDVVEWQQRRHTSAYLDQQLGYWRDLLRDVPTVLELPADRSRGEHDGTAGARIAFRIPPALRERVEAYARSQAVTPYMTLLAAFEVLIGRWTGRQRFVIGSPVSGRGDAAVDEVLGFFVDTLPLRGDLTGDPAFGELVQRVRGECTAAYAHQDVPLDRLVEELVADRQPGRTPLIQVVFALQTAATARWELPGLGVTPVPMHTATSKFDLFLELAEDGDAWRGNAEFAAGLFEPATVRRLLRHFECLLERVTESPGRPVSELGAALTPGEEADLAAWNDTTTPLAAATLPELFRRAARRHPGRIAVCGDGSELTYRQLNERTDRLAAGLRDLGVGPDTPVAVCLDRGAHAVTAILAVVKAGGAYVPLDPGYPPERLRCLIADSGARILVTEEALRATLSEAIDLPLFTVDAPIADGLPAPAPDLTGDHLAYVMYTSGSTGRPKGVQITHRGVARLVHRAGYTALGPDEVILQAAPLAFDASTFEIWGALANGGRLVVLPPGVPDPESIGTAIRRHGVTVLWLTAGLFHSLMDSDPDCLRGLDHLLVGGDVVSPAHVRRLLARQRVRVHNGYGPTESTTFACVSGAIRDEDTRTGLSIGAPITNTRVYVVDAALRPLPVGVPGELAIGGSGLARGYGGRPGATAERFVPDPFGPPGGRLYRTGDLARWRPDGTLQFLGRQDNQVKIRGFRIEPGEVEGCVRELTGMDQVLVSVLEPVPGDKRLVAYLAGPRAEEAVTGLLAGLRERLPSHLVPSAVVALPRIPLTANGKPDRAALPAPHTWGDGSGATFTAARTPVEAGLAAIWSRRLGQEAVGVHDDFFDLGGTSLLALRLLADVHREFGVRVGVAALFHDPTIAGLSRHITAAAGGKPANRPEETSCAAS